MSSPGWFPDPSGRPGQLRWWDGRAWTTHLRPADGASGVTGTTRPPGPGPVGRPRTGRVLFVAAAVLVALVVVVVLVVQRAGGGGGPGGPGGQSTSDICVTPDQSPTPPPQDTPGRVTSGRVSVPDLGSGWSLQPDTRVPFGRGMMRQQMSVDDSPPWIVSLNVGTMVSGDGFFSPEQGVHVVMPCLIGEYYFDQDVERRDVRDEALTVDGHPGWVLETELTFDIEGLDFTSERLVLVIVDLDDGTAGAVVVDLPASAADREPELRAALDDIQIS
ncbi:DUF2510 domain-containing protein [Auraticoccus monumenti]|nr:DUF2510 domain-containing protein [Auraticoccus monumenti]